MTGIKIIKNKGFTLIEVIVVMAVFMLIVGAALTIFLSIIYHQRIILSEQELLNQSSYAMEYMSKALRMAKRDDLGECILAGYNYQLEWSLEAQAYTSITFINQSDVDSQGKEACQKFYLDGVVLKEIKRYSSSELVIPVAITSPKLKFNGLTFVINGDKTKGESKDSDGVQPRVTITMEMEVTGKNPEIIKSVQTTISQRNLNAQ